MKRGAGLALALPAVAVLAAALAGCSPAPNRDEVVERFAIEVAAANDIGEPDDWTEVGESLADAAFDGNCGKPGFYTGLGDENLKYAFAVGCSFYFEDQMSETQITQMKDEMVRRIAEDIGE